MSGRDLGWLAVAVIFGILIAVFYVTREVWIHRRRRR
jgi:heme/copper-type cytochrome/quinol oxidase subunit 4